MSEFKPFDPTHRCKHCGGLKREHNKRAPYRCPTKLAETYWEPWTTDEWEASEKASADKAQAEAAAAKAVRECPFCRIIHRVVVPTVHLNGTSAKDLYEQLDGAVIVLQEGQRALAEAAPNGRDYYPQGDGAAGRAINAHDFRCMGLNRMLAELTEMRDHVQEVMNFNADRKAAR